MRQFSILTNRPARICNDANLQVLRASISACSIFARSLVRAREPHGALNPSLRACENVAQGGAKCNHLIWPRFINPATFLKTFGHVRSNSPSLHFPFSTIMSSGSMANCPDLLTACVSPPAPLKISRNVLYDASPQVAGVEHLLASERVWSGAFLTRTGSS